MQQSYAVLWQQEGVLPVAGRLQFGPQSLTLHGGDRGRAARVEILYDEISEVRRSPERLGPLRAIELESAGLGTLLLAAMGVVLDREVLWELQRIVAAHA